MSPTPTLAAPPAPAAALDHPHNLGLGSWPRRRALLSPERVAWTFEGEHSTFAEVESRVRRLANALSDAGIRRGDRIAYLGFNHPALLELLFATGRIGAVTVIVNARLARGEVEYILADAGAVGIVFGTEQAALVQALPPGGRLRLHLAVEGQGTVAAGWAQGFEEFLAAGGPQDAPAAVGLDEPALVMYTSGTTGRPKGAVLSHGNMLYSALNVVLASDVRPDDVSLAVAPLFHIAGLNGLLSPVFLKGGRSVIHRVFEPQSVLEALRYDGVSSMFAVPAMLDAIAAVPGFAEAEFPALRTLIVGGAPVPARVLRQWNAKGVGLQQGYGFTEAAPAVLLLTADDALRKEGSAGKPHFFIDVRVVDAQGADVPPGGSGEIVVRGPNVMREYWQNPAATAEAFREGWYRSGDIATIDREGFITLLDRSKDLYISGGENVYPSEVESRILDVPGVAEAAVIGVPDERWGEVGRAFVVPEPGAAVTQESVLAGLAGRLARYKLPKSVAVVASLPRNAGGKVQKHLLRAEEERRRQAAAAGTRTVTTIDGLAAYVGRDLGASEVIEVSQERIDQFAQATGDRQWIHTDPERAAHGPFGTTIAHGFLSLSLIAALTQQLLEVGDAETVINYGLERVRFPSPLPSGATVQLRANLASVDEIDGGVQVRIDATVTAVGATKPAATATSLIRYYRSAVRRTPARSKETQS